MKRCRILLCILLFGGIVVAQSDRSSSPPVERPADGYSGMYSFLQEGEFIQITVEDGGRVTGFVSRYGDLDSDKGAFLDHFLKDAKLTDNKLNFSTETVHGVWYEFKGGFGRGEGKKPGEEAYYVLKGTLSEYHTDASKKTSVKTREVAFKSFPQDLTAPPQKPD
jgi:hypothetical protein